MKKRLLQFVLVSLVAACGPADDKKPYLTRFDRPLHISHQGGADIYPSDTVIAFDHAIAVYDTDVLEIDVHRTMDGVLVVLHDETVDRMTNGTGLVKEMTLQALKSLDAGYRFTADDGASYPFRGRGVTIPTLAEVFQAFPDMLFNVEIKQLEPRIEEDLIRMIREFNLVEAICTGSFDDESAAIQRELLPEACHYGPESMATEFYASTRVGLGGAYPLPVDAFSLPPTSGVLTVLDECTVNTLHDRGKDVWAWTINDADEMRRLLDLGLDGIMTDRPDLLYDVMAEMGIR